MPLGFQWKLGDYVGGAYAVHQAYKPYLVVTTPGHDQQAVGEFLIQPGDTSDLVVSGLGFTPTVVMLVSYRPRLANGETDVRFGDRGGGMTFGAAGLSSASDPWDDTTAYVIGDMVTHEGAQYVATANNTNSEPPSANWDTVAPIQFTGSTKIRHAFDSPWVTWSEDACFKVSHRLIGDIILTLSLVSLDVGGFTLSQDLNTYDQTDYVAWLAIGGNTSVGVMSAGDTSLTGFNGTPTGATFLSVKNRTSDGLYRFDYWDHMCGFASPGSQAVVWGGRQPTAWDWTTERWEDDAAILLCQPASGSSFAGTSVLARGEVTDWDPGGINISWPIFNNEPYRIGYILFGKAEAGVIETNVETQPGGTQTDPSGSDSNFVQTNIIPDLVLMTGTNYTFNTSNADAFDSPRSPGAFQFGGSGGLGWHAAPFSDLGYDAYGVHTFGNAVAERGHYANSGTQYTRRYIMAGQGANSNPPAYHQHSINIIPSSVIVGLNYRYGERHAQVKRYLINPSDQYVP